jgi:transcriptional regulator with XRE-family HTH domain
MLATCDICVVSSLRPSEDRRRRRIVAAMDALGMSANALSLKSGVNRRVIDRLKKGERFPRLDTIDALDEALGLEASTDTPDDDSAAVDVQDVSLVGFLSSLRDSGMAKWAGMVPIQSSPTLLEAARALKYLHEHPQYSNESGVPLEGWPAFFEKLRATNFRPMQPSPKPQKTKAIADALDGGNVGHKELTMEPPKRVVRRAK